MRVILVGGGSFIARQVFSELSAEGLEAVNLAHDAVLDGVLRASDIVINFGISPMAFKQPYDRALDQDLRVATAAANAGAFFMMCSTRRVYGEAVRMGAVEDCAADGDQTHYGRNKAISEKAVEQVCGDRRLVLRLSNVFGFEYGGPPRATFFAQMLRSLRQDGVIRFDMNGRVRRDFLPVEACASAMVAAIRKGVSGVFNLGCGFPVTCESLAEGVMQGFGGGRLLVEDDGFRDEFFLDMGKWQSMFSAVTSAPQLHAYSVELGRRLISA